MEVQFAFPLQRKTKNENTIWVSFSYAIENRLALRYTDYCSIIVLVFGSSSMYSPGHTSILAAKIVSLTFLSEPQYFGPDLRRLALRYTDYCSIIVLVFGSSSMYSPGHTSILAAKIVSLTFLSEPQYFGPDLRLVRTKTALPIRSVQSIDCIPGKKMPTDNLYCFYV